MLHIIIFSFNRALQLDTLLTSLIQNWKAPEYKIDVIYNTTDYDYQKGYNLLIDKYKKYTNIVFNKENNNKDKWSIKELCNIRNFISYTKHNKKFTSNSNFRSLCIELLKKEDNEFIMFLTDDSVFIENVDISTEIFDWIKENPKKRQFSLRIGIENNSQSNKAIKQHKNYFCWNFYCSPKNTNWSYPFSVDAHIYHKSVVIKLLSEYIFCNPNTLEGNINAQVYRKRLFEEGRCFKKGILLSFPINMVQTIYNNKRLDVDAKMLNNMFLQGYTMKYPIPNDYDSFQQYPNYLLFEKDGVITKKVL